MTTGDIRRLLKDTPQLGSTVTQEHGKYTRIDCIAGTLNREHHTTRPKATEPLEKASVDTAGPLPRDVHGNRYFTAVVNSATGYTAFPIRTKGAAGPQILQWVKQIQRVTGRKAKIIHADRAPGLIQGIPRKFGNSEGIGITTTLPNTPQSNRQAEQAIGWLKYCAPQT